MKEKLSSFLRGRTGADEFSRALLAVYLVLAVLTIFVKNAPLRFVLNGGALAVCVYMFYRMLSRRTDKRAEENRKYLLCVKKTKRWFLLRRNKRKYHKTHVYRACPHCGVQIRLPRVAGAHKCNCPKCGEDFPVDIK